MKTCQCCCCQGTCGWGSCDSAFEHDEEDPKLDTTEPVSRSTARFIGSWLFVLITYYWLVTLVTG